MWEEIQVLSGRMMIDASITCYETMLNDWRKQEDLTLAASVKSSPGSNKKLEALHSCQKKKKKYVTRKARSGLTQKRFSLLTFWRMQVQPAHLRSVTTLNASNSCNRFPELPNSLRFHKQQHHSSWFLTFLWN